MRKLIYTYLALLISSFTYSQTCDLNLVSYNPTTHEVVVEFIDATNCGCNEYTQSDGNSCAGSPNGNIQNNDCVGSLVFGLHYDELYENTECTTTNFHPGWTFAIENNWSGCWSTGGTYTLELNVNDSWQCIIDNPLENYCWEIVIWQINLSQTASEDDFPDEEWWTNTCGTCADQTQMYPDIDLSNNSLVWCPDPCDFCEVDIVYVTDTIISYDTIYVDNFIYDTIYVDNFIYDTTYVDNFIYDTTYVDNFIYDTTYIDVIVDNFIYITDTTMTEYIIQTEYIDCETGLPCEDNPGIDICDDNSIFIPNTFSPNNDGVNDIFYAVTDMTCWLTWKLQIYNRWGTLVKEMTDPSDYWTGVSYSGHWLCPDGVYIWKLDATGPGSATHLNGHITIFR